MSYAREDKPFALRLRAALRTQGREVWADWEDIPAGARWEAEIASGIEAADVFVLVLSPDSVVSKECAKELRRASEHNKRLLPVLYREVGPEDAPDALRPVQWADFRDSATFDRDLEQLAEAFDTDLEWMREHTRLLRRALEWEREDRDASRLLRGRDLGQAEEWLRRQEASGARQPTVLQTGYILASRRGAVRRQRVAVAAVLVALVVAVALAVFALIQRGDAIAREKLARSRELAARSLLQLPIDPAESVRLAADAARAAPTVEAERALRRSLSVPSVGVVFERQLAPLDAAAFSPDGRLVATAAEDGKTRVRETASGALVAVLDNRSIDLVDSVRFSPDGGFLLLMGQSVAWGWKTANWKRISALDDANAQSAAFAPDGRLFFSTGGVTRTWDSLTGRTVEALDDAGSGGDTFPVAPAFSADGSVAVTSSGRFRGTALVWEVGSRKIVGVLRGRRGREDEWLAGAAVSPDGKRVVTISGNGTTRIWLAKTGRLVAVRRDDRGETSVVFGPDGKLFLTFPGPARLWDTQTGKPRRTLEKSLNGYVRSASFSPDGKLVATAGPSGARLWAVATGARIAQLRGHTGSVNDAAFNRDGTLIVTAGQEGTGRLWQVPTSAHVTLGGEMGLRHENRPELSPDGTLVVTPGIDGKARIWSATTGERVRTLTGPTALVSARFSHDGTLVTTAGRDGTVDVWQVASGKRIGRLRGRDGPVEATFSPDGTRILTVSDQGTVRLWDAAAGKSIAVLRGRFGPAGAAEFSPDGKLVLTYGRPDDTARLWDAVSGRRVAVIGGGDDEVYTATFSPDGHLLTAGLEEDGARLVDVKTRRSAYIIRGDDVGDVAAFSADGKLLVTSGQNGTAHVWDAETGTSVAVLPGPAGGVTGAAFNPAGTLVLTAGRDGTARVWEARTGTSLLALPSQQGYLYNAAFSADGKLILTGGEDGIARVYRCSVCGSVEDLLALARSRLLGRLR